MGLVGDFRERWVAPEITPRSACVAYKWQRERWVANTHPGSSWQASGPNERVALLRDGIILQGPGLSSASPRVSRLRPWLMPCARILRVGALMPGQAPSVCSPWHAVARWVRAAAGACARAAAGATGPRQPHSNPATHVKGVSQRKVVSFCSAGVAVELAAI